MRGIDMSHRGIIFNAFIVFMVMVTMTGAAFAATEYWYSSSADWTNPAKWYDGSVPIAPMADGDYLDFGDKKTDGVCNLSTDAGIFDTRLVMYNGAVLNILNGGSLGTKWGRVGHESSAFVNLSGNGTFILNEDDLWLGTDGGSCIWTMADTSSLITVSSDGNPEELFIADDGGSATLKLVGSDVTIVVQGLHLGVNSGVPQATLEFVLDAAGASTITADAVNIAAAGNAHLVISSSQTPPQQDIVLIETVAAGPIGGSGIFNTVNGAPAGEGAIVDVGGNSCSLTYQYDAAGDGANNDIALLFVETTSYASEPSPVPGETTDADDTMLSWRSAQGAVRNEIYLGTNAAAVAAAQKLSGDVDGSGTVDLADLSVMAAQWLDAPSAPCPDLDYSGTVNLPDLAKVGANWQNSADAVYLGATDADTFDPGFLEPGATYYWRVDSVFCDGIEPSPVWSFQTKLPAFPGAEGFGKWASGGRGGSVYHVTNLNDSGPGSFRDAVSQSNRTVVFDVSGIIHLDSRVVVKKDVTIAGQTAPGEGVMVYGDGLSYTNANRSITRYMRYRMGIGGTSDKDAVTIADGTDMIFDHCSISWGRDENFSISGGSDENPGLITIQDCIIAQGLMNHSCGGLITDWDDGISILRSLYIDNDTRNPKVRGINEFINNVVYHWDDGGYIMAWTDSLDYYSYVNAVNNYFISGPGISETTPFRYGNSSFHIYHSNNWYDYDEDSVFDGRVLTDADYTWNNETVVAEPFDYPGVKTLLSPKAAVKSIGSVCGASFPARDRTDKRLIEELMSYGTSGEFISDENNSPMYGVGTIASGICPTDTDQDGMPDYWEESITGLDPQVANNNGDVNGNGYTNLEDYINWLGDLHADVPKNAYADIDLRTFTSGFEGGAAYTISGATCGTAVIQPDGYTVRYTPDTDYLGLAEFEFTVNDGSTMTKTVYLLVSEYGGNPLTPVYPENLVNGLEWRYYEGTWNYLPDFSVLTPADYYYCNNFDITLNGTGDGFAYEFEGFIDIPADGQYTFYVTSDDGSRLFIDNGVVVSNDGVHGVAEAQGKAALLAGKHKIRVTYFENSGSQTLEVRWAGPGFGRQLIPNAVLYRGELDEIAPAVPEGLWAQGSDTQVNLNWQANSETDLAGYNVYRTTTSGSAYVPVNSTLVTTPTFTDTSVVNDTLYHYVVTAVDNAANESPFSDETSAMPQTAGSLIIQENRIGFCGVDDGGSIDHDNAGFTGEGFINTENAVGEGAEWNVDIPSVGTYTVSWRYANGSSDRPGNLLSGGTPVASGISFPATASDDWTVWGRVSQSVSLSAGVQTLRLEATGSGGLANIDYIQIAGANITPVACD